MFDVSALYGFLLLAGAIYYVYQSPLGKMAIQEAQNELQEVCQNKINLHFYTFNNL